MSNTVRFILALHDHQPVGNFEDVFEQAYHDSYEPFLKWFQRFEHPRMALHTSGPLIEWLDKNHPEYLDQVAELVEAGRIEILGGPFFEPILSMIPSRDRVGQIRRYTTWLEKRLGATIRGAWIPERVWEQSMTRDLVDAGIEYAVLDDHHFRKTGLTEKQLHGYFTTEDDGRVMGVFPGSERLRYTIPFADPEETIRHLQMCGGEQQDAVVVFGDDGEKLGNWPKTHKHVYGEGWLERFFGTLSDNRQWLRSTTFAEARDSVRPLGRVYLPDCSYREMGEWVLPTEQQLDLERISDELQHDPRWGVVSRFMRGGFWRNFKVRYPESNDMYSRMMAVSTRLKEAEIQSPHAETIEKAREQLYRGQCNCAYWHGAFGGIYLPHLRNAVYQHLIAADKLLDEAEELDEAQVWAETSDYNFDGDSEIRLRNNRLDAWLSPHDGGHLYELDIRSICHNLGASITRRHEAYHDKVLAGPSCDKEGCVSIHDQVVFKQPDLDQRVQYDPYPRKSLVDLFYQPDASAEEVADGRVALLGDFHDGDYSPRFRRTANRMWVLLTRQGNLFGRVIQVSKAITLDADSSMLEIVYHLENLPPGEAFRFAVEFNFAGMPSGADDRYFWTGDDANRERRGQLDTRLNLTGEQDLHLTDEWLGLDVALSMSREGSFWTFPIETVSQSEGGYELVHQSVAVQPNWLVEPDDAGKWEVRLDLAIDTTQAERRDGELSVAGV